MKYFSLKSQAKLERTKMGLIGRRKIKASADLQKVFADNYRAMSSAELMKKWFPALGPRDRKTVVVITAHDDDLLAFAGTLGKLAAEDNVEIHHLILTDGSMGCGEDYMKMYASPAKLKTLAKNLMVAKGADKGLLTRGPQKTWDEYAALLRKAGRKMADVRRGEARDAEKILGFKYTYFLDFPDTALGQYYFGLTDYQSPGVAAIAIRLVRDINPDLMILQDRHQVVDFNPDHYAAGWVGYTVYWHLHCPVLGVDPIKKPFKALVSRGFEGIQRPEFRLCDYLIELSDKYLNRKMSTLRAYKSQVELVNDLFKVEETEKFRMEGYFEVDLPPSRIE